MEAAPASGLMTAIVLSTHPGETAVQSEQHRGGGMGHGWDLLDDISKHQVLSFDEEANPLPV